MLWLPHYMITTNVIKNTPNYKESIIKYAVIDHNL